MWLRPISLTPLTPYPLPPHANHPKQECDVLMLAAQYKSFVKHPHGIASAIPLRGGAGARSPLKAQQAKGMTAQG